MNTPTVALTFDDGPSEWTEPLLDVLEERGARATFFVLGCNIAGRESTIRRAVDAGHEIGVHGWDHERMGDELPERLLRRRLRKTEVALMAAGAPKPMLWRPPWHHATAESARVVTELGYRQVGVTVDGRDVSTSEGAIVRQVVAGLRDCAIVGLHDGIAANGEQGLRSRVGTVRAVARILERCMSVTVSDLFARMEAAA